MPRQRRTTERFPRLCNKQTDTKRKRKCKKHLVPGAETTEKRLYSAGNRWYETPVEADAMKERRLSGRVDSTLPCSDTRGRTWRLLMEKMSLNWRLKQRFQLWKSHLWEPGRSRKSCREERGYSRQKSADGKRMYLRSGRNLRQRIDWYGCNQKERNLV